MSRLFENVKIDFTAAAKKAEQANKRAAQAKKETQQAKEQTEKGIQSLIDAWQELGNTKELALQKLMDTFNMDEATAKEKLQLYWKN